MSGVVLRHCWLRHVFRNMAHNHNAGKASVSGEAATVLQKATFPHDSLFPEKTI
jgi:hypothetical protein